MGPTLHCRTTLRTTKLVRGFAGAVATAVLSVLAPPPIAANAGGNSLAITGYVEEGSPLGLVNANASALTTVGVASVNLNPSANQVSTPDAPALALLARAHAQGLRGELLVGNFDNAIGDFSPRIAQQLLSSSTNIQRVAAQLRRVVITQEWDGITVDLESLNASDVAGLVAFVNALRDDLPRSRTLSIDVSANSSIADYRAGGYALGALGRIVDRVVLMAYDQHGPWSGPGPIGALAWQQQTLAVLLSQVRAAKVDLGVAGYGYTWPRGRGVHHGLTISDAGARQLVQKNLVRARWDARSGEWSATLSNGTVLWWCDRRSYRLRVALAKRSGLHGIAVWQLATSDPLTR